LSDVAPPHRLALVLLGRQGPRRLTRERCDMLVRLDLARAIESLKVSNACAMGLALAYGRVGAE
jgi:23S rRNA (guanosine2251-2'-O)-methyltransferase